MGLLDALQSPEAQLGLGLLSAAGPSAVPMSFGQRLGGAMQQFQAAKIAEEERRQKAAMQALQAQLINAQIGETQAQAKQREAEAAKLQQAALRAQQFQSDLSKAGTVSPSAALAGGGGPTQANAANIGASRPIDWQALAIQYPDQIKAIEELSKARNFGRDKVARTVKGLGPDGREYEYQVDDYGNKVGAGMAQYRAPIEVGQGDRKTFVDAYNLNPLGSFAINQSPDSKASNAVAWANNAIARDRLGWEKQQADKPQYDADRGILVYPRSGQAQDVQMGGKPIGPKDKGLNDNQAKALLFGSRMQEADKVLNSMSQAGVNTPSLIKQAADGTPLIGGILGAGANAVFASPKQQQVEQAQRDFINATLRRESGAAISPIEFDNARKQYFPQPGDSAEVMAQKAANRSLAIRGFMAEVPENQRNSLSRPTTNFVGAIPPMKNITVEW